MKVRADRKSFSGQAPTIALLLVPLAFMTTFFCKDETSRVNETRAGMQFGGNLHERIEIAGKTGFFELPGKGVNQVADSAGQASRLATAARDKAEMGGAVVGRAARTMSEINDSSKRIAEQGRSFAVVASEMRGLAGRSGTAAKEIKDLIQDSVKKVEDGSVLVAQSGQTLEQIVSCVKKVTDILASAASSHVEAARRTHRARGGKPLNSFLLN